MAHQAQETFVAETSAGLQRVVKGDVLADAHPLVKLDAGRGLLFRPLDIDGAEPAVPKRSRSRGKSAPAAAEAPPEDAPADDAGPVAAWTGDADDGGEEGT